MRRLIVIKQLFAPGGRGGVRSGPANVGTKSTQGQNRVIGRRTIFAAVTRPNYAANIYLCRRVSNGDVGWIRTSRRTTSQRRPSHDCDWCHGSWRRAVLQDIDPLVQNFKHLDLSINQSFYLKPGWVPSGVKRRRGLPKKFGLRSRLRLAWNVLKMTAVCDWAGHPRVSDEWVLS